MTELFDTSGVRDEPAQWDAFAERIAAGAARSSRTGTVEWLAQSRAGWIAACLLLGGALLSLGSMTRRDSPMPEVLAPADDLGRAMATSHNPPGIGALMARTRDGT